MNNYCSLAIFEVSHERIPNAEGSPYRNPSNRIRWHENTPGGHLANNPDDREIIKCAQHYCLRWRTLRAPKTRRCQLRNWSRPLTLPGALEFRNLSGTRKSFKARLRWIKESLRAGRLAVSTLGIACVRAAVTSNRQLNPVGTSYRCSGPLKWGPETLSFSDPACGATR